MALTKPRAYQIYDIDYKQATRVITVANITLSGGAPSQVDGVNLSLEDRVLVIGQTNKAQNGIYEVATVGTGANGTWVRSGDTNSTGELLAGTIVMVTEGLTYADTQWKLVTDNPIVIGTSELIFEQNSAFAFGNVYANGTAVLASSVGDVLTLSAGNNISISGNNTSKTVTIGVTGISLNSISNGTSNVNVVSSGGNITVGVAGTNNVAVFGSSQITFAGNVLPAANVTYSLGSSTQRWKDLWVSNSTIYLGEYAITTTGNALVFNNQTVITANSTSPVVTTGNVTGGNLVTTGVVSATGNVSGGNLTTAGQVTATGNISGGNLNVTGNIVDTGALSLITGASGNINLAPNGTNTLIATTTGANVTGTLGVTGNITGGNLSGTSITGTLTTAAQTNITSVGTLGSLTVTANVAGGNLTTAGQVVATSNVTGGNLRTASVTIGNGPISGLTTISASGNANVGNLGAATVVATTLTGTLSTAAQTNITSVGTLGSLSVTGNISGGNVSGTRGAFTNIAGTLETASQPNVTSVGTLGSLSVTGNVTGGNINSNASVTGTTISATGNLVGGNANITNAVNAATISTSGNATVGGNLIVQGNITYINIEDLQIEDPVIILGTGPNGAPLTVNDNKDRGIFMEYYTTGIGNAFIGWDNSSGNMIVASDAGLTNDVVSVETYGTLQAGNLYVQSVVSTGNITGGNIIANGRPLTSLNASNIDTGTLAQARLANSTLTLGNTTLTLGATTTTVTGLSSVTSTTFVGALTGAATTAGTVTTAAQPNITSVGTLSSLTVTANVAGGNLTTAGQVSATGNVTGGNIVTAGNVNSNQGFFSGNVTVIGTFTSTSNIVANTSGTFFGNAVTGNSAIFAGVPTFTPLGTNVVAQFSGNVNSYSQINFENISNGNRASTDYIATADNGTDTTNYADFGINSSTFDDPVSYPGYGPNDSYVHNHGGNLILNPESAGKTIKMMVGGTATANVVANVSTTGVAVTGIVSATGNVSGGNITTAGQVSATGNINTSGAFVGAGTGLTGTASSLTVGTATTAGTVTTAAQPNITSVGTLSSLTVTANVAGGNLTTAGQVVATGNVTGGNLNVSGNIVDTGALTVITGSSGNINLAPNGTNTLIATTTGANISGTLGVTGNITGGNLSGTGITGTLLTAAQTNITSVGTLGSLTVTANISGGNLTTAGQVVAVGNISGGNILGNGAGLTGINTFSNVTVTGGNSAVADSIADTLTFTAGDGIAITIDSTTDTITIAASGGSEIFVDGADFGTVTEAVTLSDDLGLVTEAVDSEADLGSIVTSGLIYPDQFVLPSYTTTTLPSASIAGAMIYVSNETGGAVPAFSDGTNWRRVTDRAIVS
jgi:hypothetical protein